MPYMSDPSIVKRVKKYLESNVDKTYVDINVMADDLQKKYREYANRKRSAFRASVSKAYSIVLQSYSLEGESSEEDSVHSDEGEITSTPENKLLNNSLNNQLVDLYTRSSLPKQMEENELIDISSDDSEDSPPNCISNKISNGASTSNKIYPPSINKDISSYEDDPYEKKNVNQEFERGKKRKIENTSVPSVRNYKRKRSVTTFQEAFCTFKDVGGMDNVLEEICKLLMHIKHPEIYKTIGISPPRGFLLHGPPGCGKTLLANAISGELNVPLLKVAAPELVAGVSGESEERIRDLFDQALKIAPCVLFIDEIDAITPNRQNAQKEMERRIVAQLLSCLDDLNKAELGNMVLVIGATNRPDSIDPALRRAGRFDREISLGIPNLQSRAQILKVVSSKLKLSENFDFGKLASRTPGFVGADLLSLIRESAMVAVNRILKRIKESRQLVKAVSDKNKKVECIIEDDKSSNTLEIIVDDDISKEESANGITSENTVVVIDDDNKNTFSKESSTEKVEITIEQDPMPVDIIETSLNEMLTWLHDKYPVPESELQNLCLTMEDFDEAIKCVQPSAKREGFATVPDVTWDDVGSLRDIREDLQMTIVAPVRHAKEFEALGIDVSTGVLLCGPPGCGKTLLAKAIANEAGINFISVKGPELLNMYVGESERAVRVCFERARNSAPCVIFFDELDALCPKRSDSRESSATSRVVNQMLTEMDGIGSRKGVFILAASNRPDIIDSAVLRPGRLDKILYVGLPSASDRVDILRAITKNGTCPRLAPDVDLDSVGKSEQCRGYTGADLAALVREASVIALKEFMVGRQNAQEPIMVCAEHFQRAVTKIRPSVSEKDQKHYEKLRKMYSSVLDIGEVEEMEYS